MAVFRITRLFVLGGFLRVQKAGGRTTSFIGNCISEQPMSSIFVTFESPKARKKPATHPISATGFRKKTFARHGEISNPHKPEETPRKTFV
jgi:hypothetical protein